MSTSLAEEEAVELFNTIQLEHGAAEKVDFFDFVITTV